MEAHASRWAIEIHCRSGWRRRGESQLSDLRVSPTRRRKRRTYVFGVVTRYGDGRRVTERARETLVQAWQNVEDHAHALDGTGGALKRSPNDGLMIRWSFHDETPQNLFRGECQHTSGWPGARPDQEGLCVRGYSLFSVRAQGEV